MHRIAFLGTVLLVLFGSYRAFAQDGGLVVHDCDRPELCSEDTLEIVFDNGSSTLDGPFDVGEEISVRVVVETRAATIGLGWVFKHDTTCLEPISDTLRGGDVNGDGRVNLTDAANLVRISFLGKPALFDCFDARDANADGLVDGSDVVRVLAWLFADAPSFADPFQYCGRSGSRLCAEASPACR